LVQVLGENLLMRGQPLTEEQKELIKEYYFDERVGYRTIGRRLDLHYDTVRRYIKTC